jgi:hypothetical protein
MQGWKIQWTATLSPKKSQKLHIKWTHSLKRKREKRKEKERKGRKKHPTPHTQRLRSNSVKKLRLKLMDQTKKESIRYRNQSTKISADVMRYY